MTDADKQNMTAESQALLIDLARRCEDLAGTLPQLDLPPEELATVAGELQRVAVRLSLVEERLAQIGPNTFTPGEQDKNGLVFAT